MALGALTGAGMFVGCVVAGRILTLNAGAKARWAQIRDVFFYLLAVATVTGICELAGWGWLRAGWAWGQRAEFCLWGAKESLPPCGSGAATCVAANDSSRP